MVSKKDLESGLSVGRAEKVPISSSARLSGDCDNQPAQVGSLHFPHEEPVTADRASKASADTPAANSENEDDVEYKSLIKKKRNLLCDPAQPLERSALRNKLLVLFRMNVLEAEAVLYKDYILSWPSEGGGPKVRDWEELQRHLTRFCEAEASYQALIDALSFSKDRNKSRLKETEKLIDIAARLAVLEECRSSRYEDSHRSSRNSGMFKRLETDIARSFCITRMRDTNDDTDKENFEFLQDPDSKTEEDAFWEKRRTRYINHTLFAVFGGLSLIVPMLVMTLHKSVLTALLTSSLCIFAIAAILAYVMNTADAKDIVGATVGYAAVLVVFVGAAMEGAVSAGFDAGKVAAIVVGSLAGASLALYVFIWFIGLFGPGERFNSLWREIRFGVNSREGPENAFQRWRLKVIRCFSIAVV